MNSSVGSIGAQARLGGSSEVWSWDIWFRTLWQEFLETRQAKGRATQQLPSPAQHAPASGSTQVWEAFLRSRWESFLASGGNTGPSLEQALAIGRRLAAHVRPSHNLSPWVMDHAHHVDTMA